MKHRRIILGSIGVILFCLAGYVAVSSRQKKPQEIHIISGDKNDSEGEGSVEASKERTLEPLPKENIGGDETEMQKRMVCVFVCGAVLWEGVYFLPEGAREADAVSAAGGFAPEADATFRNLAAPVTDGQKLYVPTTEETEGQRERPWEDGGVRTTDGTEILSDTEKVNINLAGKEALMTLPGIGAAKAEAIIQYRRVIGGFHSVEELKCVSGIGEAMYDKLKDRISTE